MKKSAFTLIELAAVLAIISVLVVFVTRGGSMINSSRIASARSATASSPVPEISGLVAWYEASSKESFNPDEITNTDNSHSPANWYDISPASITDGKNVLTKTGSTSVPYVANGINNAPAIRFNGSSKFSLSAFYQGSLSQATVFMVFKPEYLVSSTTKFLFDAATSQNTFQFGIRNNLVNINAGTSATTGTSTNPAAFAAGSNYIVAVYFNSVGSQSFSGAYVNNAATKAGNSNLNCGTNTLTGLSIGADKNTANGFTGLVSEIIIYNRPLQLQERKDVMNYLSKKYGITVTGI